LILESIKRFVSFNILFLLEFFVQWLLQQIVTTVVTTKLLSLLSIYHFFEYILAQDIYFSFSFTFNYNIRNYDISNYIHARTHAHFYHWYVEYILLITAFSYYNFDVLKMWKNQDVKGDKVEWKTMEKGNQGELKEHFFDSSNIFQNVNFAHMYNSICIMYICTTLFVRYNS